MHPIEVPESIRERARKSHGGRDHFLTDIDPSRTAHIIVDLQKGFMSPGAPVEVPVAREIVVDVIRISSALRKAGGLNVFLRYTYDRSEKLSWTAFYRDYQNSAQTELMAETFSPGAPYFELWDELDIQPSDLIVNKTRFSGMIPGTCDLHDILRARKIDTLIITGTLTNCCCESTARDAMQMNYKIIFVADANAALTDEEHLATLSSMTAIFADVMPTDMTVAAIAKATGRKANAA
jgi:ureidoacrylate peracid hydrolase